MFEIIFLISLSAYFIISVIVVAGLKKKFSRRENYEPKASIIVAAKDEEENILECLQSLSEIDYPKEKLEIILVDDFSSDKTGIIIKEFILDKPQFKKIIPQKELGNLKGKANAIASGIRESSGEIIITTDADCIVPAGWVKNIVSHYDEETGLVNGFTTMHAKNAFSGMQAIDLIYLLSIAAGFINHQKPVSCIGNNMSYHKKAYEESGGYENLPFSVTEDAALLKAVGHTHYQLKYILDEESLVITKPLGNLTEILHQKKRWAAGSFGIPARGFAVLAAAFLTNLCLLCSPLFFSAVALYLAVFKLAIDFFVLYPVHKKLGLEKNLKYFLPFEIYYTLYISILPFILMLNRKIVWKGREYSASPL